MSSADLTVVSVWAAALARADDRAAVLDQMAQPREGTLAQALAVLQGLATDQPPVAETELTRVVGMAWRAALEAVPR